MARSEPGAVYNVADDEPAPRGEVTEFARSLLFPRGHDPMANSSSTEEASSGTAESSESPGSGAGSSDGGEESAGSRRGAAPLEEKRVRNAKIKQDLGVALQFPSYREGVGALAVGDTQPFSAEDLEYLTAS